MHKYLYTRIQRPHDVRMRWLKMMMDRAVSTPKNDLCLDDLFCRQTTKPAFCLIEQYDLIKRNAHLEKGRIPSKMLIGEKEYFFKSLLECPFKNCFVIRTGRDGTTMFATKCFDRGA